MSGEAHTKGRVLSYVLFIGEDKVVNTMNVQGYVCGNERRSIFKPGMVTMVFTWAFFC